MVLYRWLNSEELTRSSSYVSSEFFCKYSHVMYSDWGYKEKWGTFLKIYKFLRIINTKLDLINKHL